MKIRLTDISKDGRTYHFDRQTADLNAALADLIQNQDYIIDFHLRPLNTKTFEMKGSLKAYVASLCSKCGEDFTLEVSRPFHEILTPAQPSERTGRYSRTHVSDDDAISNYEYPDDMMFDVSEYFHEILGIAIPAFPKHPEAEMEVCNDALKALGIGPFSADKEIDYEEKPNSPFSSLKDLGIDLKPN